MSMNVVHLLNNFDQGGAESLIYDFAVCSVSKKENWSFFLLSGKSPGDNVSRIQSLKKMGVPVYAMPNFIIAIACIFKLCLRGKVDVLHSHNLRGLICACFCKIFFWKRVIVFTQHTSYLKRKRYHFFLKWLVNGYIAICKSAQESMLNNGIPQDKIHLVHNGVSEINKKDFFFPMVEGKNFVVVGRMVPEKNHAMLVDAVAKVARSRPEKKFAIWFFGDGPLREFIEGRAREQGVEERLKFLGSVSEAKSYLHNFDFFLMSSNVEGMPISALEALASGIPVMSTNVGGLFEIINQGRNGLIVPPDDVEEFSAAIQRILEEDLDVKYKESMKHAKADYSIDGVMDKHSELYRCLVAI